MRPAEINDVKHLGRTCVYFCHINLTTWDAANASILSALSANCSFSNAASSQQINYFIDMSVLYTFSLSVF